MPRRPKPTPKNAKPGHSHRKDAPSTHQSLAQENRPGPGETEQTAEHPSAHLDAEEQNGGRRMEEELFGGAIDDDAGSLPHQLESNTGPVREGSVSPPRPNREPKSLPRKTPTL